jgi:hypothetical protein
VNRTAGLFGNHFQVGLPHVAAHELQFAGTFLAQHTEERHGTFDEVDENLSCIAVLMTE